MQVDPTGALTSCLSNVVTLDLSYNNISSFPSFLIYNMQNLANIYFQHNQLTEVPANSFYNVSVLEIINFSYNQLTTFELWTLDVKIKADFSYNKITTITNNYFYTANPNRTIEQSVSLTGNGPLMNFTDAVYEMYDHCKEVQEWFFSESNVLHEPLFTLKMGFISFGTTLINCSCDQAYFTNVFLSAFDPDHNLNGPYPIINATCASQSGGTNSTILFNSSCATSRFVEDSTVDFAQVYPRLCEIQGTEGGEVMNITEISPPLLNVVRHIYK